jgi:hypothetical protein
MRVHPATSKNCEHLHEVDRFRGKRAPQAGNRKAKEERDNLQHGPGDEPEADGRRSARPRCTSGPSTSCLPRPGLCPGRQITLKEAEEMLNAERGIIPFFNG